MFRNRNKSNEPDPVQKNFSERYNMGRTPGQFDQGSRSHEHGTHQDYYPKDYDFDIGHLGDFHQEAHRPHFDGGISGNQISSSGWPASSNGLGRQNQAADNLGETQGRGYSQGHDYFRSPGNSENHYGKGPPDVDVQNRITLKE